MDIRLGFANLWLILTVVFVLTALIMKIASAHRGNKILNPEDHKKSNIISFMINFVLFFVVCLLTPIVTGLFFWIGIVLLVIAGVIYILSIVAFLNNKTGLTTNSIYSITRNPMYVAMSLLLVSFFLIALQSNGLSALLLSIITLIFFILIHIRVLNEEKYLAKKYKDIYSNYTFHTPRYIPTPRYMLKNFLKKR